MLTDSGDTNKFSLGLAERHTENLGILPDAGVPRCMRVEGSNRIMDKLEANGSRGVRWDSQ